MIMPNPDVLERLIRERQRELRRAARKGSASAGPQLRVRIGHALIGVGRAVAGERAERTHRRPALPHTA